MEMCLKCLGRSFYKYIRLHFCKTIKTNVFDLECNLSPNLVFMLIRIIVKILYKIPKAILSYLKFSITYIKKCTKVFRPHEFVNLIQAIKFLCTQINHCINRNLVRYCSHQLGMSMLKDTKIFLTF